MGNGAKAQQKRERNQRKNPAGAKNQTKAKANIASEGAKNNIICTICKQPFFLTARPPELEVHAQNKHSKTLDECFPSVSK